MNNLNFYKNLESDDLSIQSKIDTCQYYLDNYPVKIETRDPMNPFNAKKAWTKLEIKINDGSDKAINYAFEKLQNRIDEFKKFDDGQYV